jgi:probable HAF family extracellular repeat protein
MNATGQIVGSYTNATGTHGFVLSGGIDYTTLDDPVAAFGNTIARGINTTGMIVGYYKDVSNDFHGFLYFNGLYAPIDDPLATTSTQAFGINAAGQIVGVYVNATGPHGGRHLRNLRHRE